MKFAFYCRELRFSGGRSVALGFLNALKARNDDHEFIIYAPEDPGYHDLEATNMHVHIRHIHGGIRQMLAQNSLRTELKRDQPDVLFMMGNLGYRNSPCPQAVLVHNPWILYPETPAWKRLSPRDRCYYAIRRRLQSDSFAGCDAVLTQTPVMLDRLNRSLKIPYAKMALMPNSVTPVNINEENDTEISRMMKSTSHSFRALCLSRYFPHKNLSVLLQVADELRARNRKDILLITTVNKEQHPEASFFLKELRAKKREEVMLNIGEVPMRHVPSCYHAADCMILPTLLESFTGNYPDAMQAGVPIVTSDLDFAHVVCADAALYIDPMDAKSIAQALIKLADTPELRSRLISTGRERFTSLSVSWDAIARDTLHILERLALKQPLPNVMEHPWMKEWQAHYKESDAKSGPVKIQESA